MSLTYLQDLSAFATKRKTQLELHISNSPPVDQNEEENKNLISEADLATYLNILSIAPSSRDNFPSSITSNNMRSVTFPEDDNLLSIIHSIPPKALQYPETNHRKPNPHTSSPNRARPSTLPEIPLIKANIPPCSLHKTCPCPHPFLFPPIGSSYPEHASPLQSISTILSANNTIQAWISSIPFHIALPNSEHQKSWQSRSQWSFPSQQIEREELYTLICLGYDLFRISIDLTTRLGDINRDFLEATKSLLGVMKDTGDWLVEMEKSDEPKSINGFLFGGDRTPDQMMKENMAKLEVIRVGVVKLLREMQKYSYYDEYVSDMRDGFKSLARGKVLSDSGKGFWIVCPVGAKVMWDIMGEVELGLRKLREEFVGPIGEVVVELEKFTQERLEKDRGKEVLGKAKDWLSPRYKKVGDLWTEYRKWDVVFASIKAGYKVINW
ncbi:hypothetical protein QBC38DRAFT_500902 [Podospora fimiseda]|uniref:Uncharacterized protein n=1 Tax=Podospora fimiseda TaxID=252190 RepID=A0AAN7BM46_9PEZI|nr:hypothetical protein QBC38DRAFT_500902 [Podospora fimiseda]